MRRACDGLLHIVGRKHALGASASARQPPVALLSDNLNLVARLEHEIVRSRARAFVPRVQCPNHSSAAVLAATWWDLNEWLIGEKISYGRNLRYAARLRGALADLRQEHGSSAVLLVPLFLPWRKDIVELLQSKPEVEENSSNKTSTAGMEEE